MRRIYPVAIGNKSMCWYKQLARRGKTFTARIRRIPPVPYPQDIKEPSRDLKKNTKEVTKKNKLYNVYCSFNNFGVNHAFEYNPKI